MWCLHISSISSLGRQIHLGGASNRPGHERRLRSSATTHSFQDVVTGIGRSSSRRLRLGLGPPRFQFYGLQSLEAIAVAIHKCPLQIPASLTARSRRSNLLTCDILRSVSRVMLFGTWA